MRSTRLVVVALAALVAGLVLTGCGALQLQQLPAPAGVSGPAYRVSAQFRDVGNLTVGAKVKLDGVVIGEVTGISTHDYLAAVAMRISDRFPLAASSTFQVRFTTPLGENFVAVSSQRAPGGARLADGAVVPAARTTEAPTIEDTFAAVSVLLNGGGLDKLHTIVTELDRALTGRTGSARDALRQLRDLAAHLNAHTGDLDRALTSLRSLSTSLDRGTPLIEQALNTFPDTFQALADDTAKLRTLVTKVGDLGDAVSTALRRGQGAMLADLDALRPTLDALRSADGQLLPTFASLERFGALVQQAAPGDYVNLSLAVRVPLDVPPQTPGVSAASVSSADAVRTLLTGGLH